MHKTASSCIRRVTHAGDTWETHRRTGPHLRPPPSGDPVSGSRWDPSILLPCHSAFWGDSHTPLFLLHHLNPLPPFNVAQEPCTQLDGLKKESKSHSVTSDSVTPWTHTVHGILQARILEWVAIPFSKGSSQPRDRTQVSCIAGGFFTS